MLRRPRVKNGVEYADTPASPSPQRSLNASPQVKEIPTTSWIFVASLAVACLGRLFVSVPLHLFEEFLTIHLGFPFLFSHLFISPLLPFSPFTPPPPSILKAESQSPDNLPLASPSLPSPLCVPRGPRHLLWVDLPDCGRRQPTSRSDTSPPTSAHSVLPLWRIFASPLFCQPRATNRRQPLLRLPRGLPGRLPSSPTAPTQTELCHALPHLHSTSSWGVPALPSVPASVTWYESLWRTSSGGMA